MNNMNNIQKMFVMVAVGSLILFLITIYALGFNAYEWVLNDFGYQDLVFKNPFKKWFQGVGIRTNWLGIIAIVNISISIVGFFLFKDKK